MASGPTSSEGEGKGSKEGLSKAEVAKLDKTIDKAIKSDTGKK